MSDSLSFQKFPFKEWQQHILTLYILAYADFQHDCIMHADKLNAEKSSAVSFCSKIVSVGTRSLKAVTFLTKRLSQLSDAFWKTVSKRISSTWWFSETNQLKVPQFLVVSVECYTAETRFFRNMARATFYFLQKSNCNKKGPVGRQFFIKFPFWSIFCRLRI